MSGAVGFGFALLSVCTGLAKPQFSPGCGRSGVEVRSGASPSRGVSYPDTAATRSDSLALLEVEIVRRLAEIEAREESLTTEIARLRARSHELSRAGAVLLLSVLVVVLLLTLIPRRSRLPTR